MRNLGTGKCAGRFASAFQFLFRLQWITSCLVLCGLAFSPEADAQQPESPKPAARYTVRGTVKDMNGISLPGVSIMVKGSSSGVVSDTNGNFNLHTTTEHPVLQFSFIGMKPKEIACKDNDFLDVVMEENVTVLNDVLVTGYQTISKERATGSFDVLSQKVLENPSSSIAQRLVGTVAGINASLDADGNPSFVIRGQGTFLNSSPLVVVDGFVISGDFSSINPNDVASVTVLKDAAAASIWGSRASNGVIVVTTKKGKAGGSSKGNMDVSFSAMVKVGAKTDLDYLRNMPSSAELIEWEKMTSGKYGYLAMPAQVSEKRTMRYYYQTIHSQGQMLYDRYAYDDITEEEMYEGMARLSGLDNTGQIKKYLLQRPVTQQYNLSLSGGSDRMSNHVSLLYGRDISRYQGEGNQSFQFDYRGKASLARWLDLNLSTMLRYDKGREAGVSASVIKSLAPYDMLLDEYGNYTDVSHTRFYSPMVNGMVPLDVFPYSDWSYNPVRERRNTRIDTGDLEARLQGGLTFKIVDGLSLESKIQYEYNQYDARSLYNEETFMVRNFVNSLTQWDLTTGAVSPFIPTGSIRHQTRTTRTSYDFRNQLNFDRIFAGRHAVNFIAGLEVSQQKINGHTSPTAFGYDDKHLTVGILPGSLSDIRDFVDNPFSDSMFSRYGLSHSNKYTEYIYRYFSAYGNVAYTFDDKYTVSASVRTDASNFITDDPSYRYSPFWSAGVSWNMMREDFLSAQHWIDLLRLRATYGYNGMSDNATSVKPLISMLGYNASNGELEAEIASKGNPLLRWERTGVIDLGTDFSFWKGKLYGKIDYYRKHGKDILANISIPLVNGESMARFNGAEILNNGIEFELGSRQAVNGFVWNGSLNFAYNRNVVKKLFRTEPSHFVLVGSGGTTYVEGKPINAMYAYRYGGMQNVGTEEDPRIMPVILLTEGNVMPITGSTTLPALSFCEYQGTTVAPYTVNMNHSFAYKNFDLSFILTGKFGHVFRSTGFNFPTAGTFPNRLLSEMMNASPDEMIVLPEDEEESMWNSNMTGYMNYLTRKANLVRMQELTLSYNLPSAALRKIYCSRATVYVQGNNLFTVKCTKEDPEFLYGRIRLQPSWTLGLRVSF